MRLLIPLALAAAAGAADVAIGTWNGMLLVTAPAGDGLHRLGGRLAQRITLDARDQPLTETADLLRGMTGLNVVLAPELQARPPRITLQVRDMGLDHVLAWIARVGGVHIGYLDGALYLADRPLAGAGTMRLYDVSDLALPRRDFPGPALALDRTTTAVASAPAPSGPVYDLDSLVDVLNRHVNTQK